jgi:hypothetical protein
VPSKPSTHHWFHTVFLGFFCQELWKDKSTLGLHSIVQFTRPMFLCNQFLFGQLYGHLIEYHMENMTNAK